jgi:NTP pyrophosphatase (non-canonical NTP hydrolase)
MEECCELAQDTAKAKRFGIHEQRDLPTSNHDRMQKEFNDVLAMIEMLNDEPGFNLIKDPELIRHKRAKVEKYLLYSQSCGTLSEGN